MEKKENVVKSRLLSESKDGICMVCCETMDCISIGNCDHPICYKCSARMRVKSDQNYCPSCRTELPEVVFCHKLKNFKEYQSQKLLSNRKFGILFEDMTIKKKFEALISYACVLCGVDLKAFDSMDGLKSHIRKAHAKQFCSICVKHLSVFPSELKLYSKTELVRHRKDGDNDEKSHRGHPECRFCDERYFDNDALLLHLRKSHFWCHFCEHDGKQDYYDVYDSLRKHFNDDHYLCDEGNCRNEKFTSVFRDKIDFQAHKLAHHGKKLNKFQAKEARKVDIDFSFGARQSGQSSVVTGADFEDVRRDDNRRDGNRRHRYHRETNGTLNYYDYENVEDDRRKFLGKVHRHEAEEVDKERTKVDHAMAASATLSSSEPDIARASQEIRPKVDHHTNNEYGGDDVIGLSEHINSTDNPSTNHRKKADNRPTGGTALRTEGSGLSENQHKKNQMKEKQSQQLRHQQQKQQQQLDQKSLDVTDFPSLPGAKQYLPTKRSEKTTEEFPALPSSKPDNKTKSSKSPKANGNHTAFASSSSQKPTTETFAQMNGIQVTKTKNRKKGKSKIKQPDLPPNSSKEFGSLGSSNNTTIQPDTTTQNHKNKNDNDTKKTTKTDDKKEEKHEKHSTEKSSRKPPPGFKSNISVANSGSRPPPGIDKMNSYPELPTSAKKLPPGFKTHSTEVNSIEQRNIRLMAMLQANLDDLNLNIFKDLSGQFRRGDINGTKYYIGISELLKENFKFIFSELVDLLPDEEKRQELLRVQNDFKIKAKQQTEKNSATVPDYSKPQRWGATNSSSNALSAKEENESRCEKCGVTMKTEDVLEHMESHQEAFPALPVTTKKKKNYSFNTSTKHYKSSPAKSAWGK